MSAFFVFHSTVRDPQKFQAYAQAAGPTLAPFEGAVVHKGKAEWVGVYVGGIPGKFSSPQEQEH